MGAADAVMPGLLTGRSGVTVPAGFVHPSRLDARRRDSGFAKPKSRGDADRGKAGCDGMRYGATGCERGAPAAGLRPAR
jgi:hypothetical protein